MWYCAHAIFYFKLKDQSQDSFLIHENVYLIEAANDDEANEKARRVAKESEDLSEDGHLEVNEKPASYVFAGIRKLISVVQDSNTSAGKLVSDVELTYSELEVDTLQEVHDLAKGKFVNVLYRE